LADPRFAWNIGDLAKKIKNGKLSLEGLSTAQAAMVVKVLRGLQIKISWRQHVYS